jgi:hypothetical protein
MIDFPKRRRQELIAFSGHKYYVIFYFVRFWKKFTQIKANLMVLTQIRSVSVFQQAPSDRARKARV